MESETTWGRLVTLDEALAEDARLLRLTAPVGAGKTEFIVRKAVQLVAEGADAAKIACVVSSPVAARRLRERLRHADVTLGRCVVLTPLQLFMGILATHDAQRFTKRVPRLLCSAEFNMLLEDLKISSPDLATLRAWVPKVFRGLGTLKDASAWGLSEVESNLHRTMLAHLEFQGAILREEAPALASAFLQASPDAQNAYFAVLVDDAQNLGALTMEACRLLASDMLVVCGNPNQAQAGFDHRASAQAFCEFGATADCLQLKGGMQPAAIATFADALCSRDAMEADIIADISGDGLHDEDALTCIKWREPADEFDGIARMVQMMVKGRGEMYPGDIFILAPNRYWAQAIARRLKKHGLASTISMGADPVAGNPHIEGSGSLDAYCRLALAANIDDISAWRLWCGLGHKSCRSKAWNAFEAWADSRSLSAVDALAKLGASSTEDELFEGASELRARYLAGMEAARELASRHGFALTKAIRSYAGGQQIVDALAPFRGDEDASELYDRLVEISFEPNCVLDRNSVTIGSYKLIQGLDPHCVIACGLIGGYVPRISHADLVKGAPATVARLDAERRVFYNVAGKARDTLVLSTVQRAETALAEKLQMDARRTRREHGKEVVVLERSCFIDETGDAAPSSVSGEQFLAELDRNLASG